MQAPGPPIVRQGKLRDTTPRGFVAFQRIYRMLRVGPPVSDPEFFTRGTGMAFGATKDGVDSIDAVVNFTNGRSSDGTPVTATRHSFAEAGTVPPEDTSYGVDAVGENFPRYAIRPRSGGVVVRLNSVQLPEDEYVQVRVIFPEPADGQSDAEGRRHIEPILAILRLVLGERVLFALVSECEIRRNDDGTEHVTFHSPVLTNESAFELVPMPDRFGETLEPLVATLSFLQRSDKREYERAALALRWYRRGTSQDGEFADQYLALWIAAEVAGRCGHGSKPRALNKLLADKVLKTHSFTEIRERLAIDQLEQLRNDIVHRGAALTGAVRPAWRAKRERLQDIVEQLLRVSLGAEPTEALERYFKP